MSVVSLTATFNNSIERYGRVVTAFELSIIGVIEDSKHSHLSSPGTRELILRSKESLKTERRVECDDKNY